MREFFEVFSVLLFSFFSFGIFVYLPVLSFFSDQGTGPYSQGQDAMVAKVQSLSIVISPCSVLTIKKAIGLICL